MDKNYLIGLGISDEQAEVIADEAKRELETERESAKKELLRAKFELAVRSELERAGARSLRAARAALDYEWDGGEFDLIPEGIDAAVASLAASAPYLFREKDDIKSNVKSDAKEVDEVYTFYGISPAEESDIPAGAPDMSYSEYMRIFKNIE